MRLVYIDESCNADSYWFGAVLVPEASDAFLQREILSIPGRYATHGVAPEAEIHRYPLWNATDDWKPLANDPRLRVDAMFRALRTVERAEADIIFVGVDRRVDDALKNLNQARATTVDKLLNCLEEQCGNAALNERCLLIFDEETSTSKELFEVVHQHHRRTLVSGQDPVIVERPVIAPSNHTPGVQVADVAVYLRRREYVGVEDDERAHIAREKLLAPVRKRVYCEQTP